MNGTSAIKTETKTEPFPGWTNALKIITDRVEKEGFGITFSHEEIEEMIYVVKPETGTYEDYEKFALKKLSQLDRLKQELYESYNLCLDSDKGKGYVVLHPNDQIKIKPKEHLRKAGREVRKAIRSLVNVQEHLLDAERRMERDALLEKSVFIKTRMGSRRLKDKNE